MQLQDAWLAQGATAGGAMFRRLRDGLATPQPMSDRAIARVVQHTAAGHNLGPSQRASFVTTSARAGAGVFKLKEVGRHESTDVLAFYVRDAHLFDDHAGESFL